MAFYSFENNLIEESSIGPFIFYKGLFGLKSLGERLESDKVSRSHDLANGGQNMQLKIRAQINSKEWT